jgi:hypothetical protein
MNVKQGEWSIQHIDDTNAFVCSHLAHYYIVKGRGEQNLMKYN